MVDVVRVTQQNAEVLSTGGTGDDKVRVTQQYAEVLSTGGLGDNKVQVTQQYAEVLRSLGESSGQAPLVAGPSVVTVTAHGR